MATQPLPAQRLARKLVAQGTKLTLVGPAAGTIAALIFTHLLTTLRFGVKETDPVTYVGATALLVLAALAACYLPARKATAVDPVQALHIE
jgi:putative ABC transport system permease protein